MPADSSNLVVSPHFLESGSIYVFKRDFDAYFCSVGHVYVKIPYASVSMNPELCFSLDQRIRCHGKLYR